MKTEVIALSRYQNESTASTRKYLMPVCVAQGRVVCDAIPQLVCAWDAWVCAVVASHTGIRSGLARYGLSCPSWLMTDVIAPAERSESRRMRLRPSRGLGSTSVAVVDLDGVGGLVASSAAAQVPSSASTYRTRHHFILESRGQTRERTGDDHRSMPQMK